MRDAKFYFLNMNFRGKFIKSFLVGSVIIFIILFLHYIKILRPLETLVFKFTSPVVGFFYDSSNWLGNKYLNFQSRAALLQENKRLKTDLADLLLEKNQFLTEKEENQFLRDLLNWQKEERFFPFVTKIIGKFNQGSQNSLIIWGGEDKGFQVGSPVLGDKNFLIGKIIKVNKNSSHVLLINDDFSRLAVKLQNGQKTAGVLQGQYGLGLIIKMIPTTELFKEGDLVVTSGLEQAIPDGILVGNIKEIRKYDEDLFSEATVISPIDFSKINIVSVLVLKDENK